MMKKLLLTIAFAATFGIVNSFSQACTPNISCLPSGATQGLCPDSATGIPQGCVNVPYSTTISFKVPSTSSGATIVDVEIKSITGLAPGLTYACAPANCKFPGGSNGCAIITGTPTAVHNQNIVVNTDAHASLGGFPITQPQTFKQYFSIINLCTGLGESFDVNVFDVKQNTPNPFNDKAEISFSTPIADNVEFKVYNIVGAVVYNKTFNADKGVNTITIDANSFSAGVYIYSLTQGNTTITKRMVVSGK